MSAREQVDRAKWEQECLAELRSMVERLRGTYAEHDIRQVDLEGEYPNTKITVRYWNPARQREQKDNYELWGSLFKAPWGRESPDQVALLVHTWVNGG